MIQFPLPETFRTQTITLITIEHFNIRCIGAIHEA